MFNPGWFGHTSSIDAPCVTVVARQDKAPLTLISINQGMSNAQIEREDSDIMATIKMFMLSYGISDILQRMLRVVELKRITGFADDYVLLGPQDEQKKFIGNAVPVGMARALAHHFHQINS